MIEKIENTQEQYEFSTKLRDKNIKFRKWKVKDKKKVQANKGNNIPIKQALVYDCLEDKKIGFNDDEYRYMLIKIREKSIGEDIDYVFTCSACEEDFDYTAHLPDVIKEKYKPYGDIKVNNHIFTMGWIQNREIYDQAISSVETYEELFFVDFIFHVKSYNDSEGYSFEDLYNIIDNFDVDVYEEIFTQWEKMSFKLNTINDVTCPHCGVKNVFEFDLLPGFFPKSWDI